MTNEERYQRLVNILQELRRKVGAAEIRLLRKAVEIEASHERLWRQFHVSFGEFLEHNHIMDAKRFGNFKVVTEQLREADVECMGLEAAFEAVKISDGDRRTKFVEAAIKRREMAGVPWSAQQARAARKEIAGTAPKDSKWNRMNALENENIALKRQVQDLQREIAEKDAEIKKLKTRLRRAGVSEQSVAAE